MILYIIIVEVDVFNIERSKLKMLTFELRQQLIRQQSRISTELKIVLSASKDNYGWLMGECRECRSKLWVRACCVCMFMYLTQSFI